MTLDTYLNSTPDSAAALAQRIGVSAASISRIRKGEQNISLALAMKIERETGGKVKLADLAKGFAA
jgi:DNA-binding transcriptional regulator YdaS (Cro superfamily)